jgi:hypothetical protein
MWLRQIYGGLADVAAVSCGCPFAIELVYTTCCRAGDGPRFRRASGECTSAVLMLQPPLDGYAMLALRR